MEIRRLFTLVSALPVIIFGSRAWPQETDASPTPGREQNAYLYEEDHAYLLRHNPFYFAYGNPLSKVQLSFRMKPIADIPLYFAYTQLMFWELQRDSKPFHDLTYNPEFFYRNSLSKNAPIKSVDLGWQHDSNGKSGEDSRSYNSIYLRLNAEREYDRWLMRASLTGAYLHAFGENSDIQNYLGPFTLKIAFIQLWNAWIDKSEFAIQATPAGEFAQDWNRGGYQFSFSFRVGKIKLIPSFYLQYYTGYAESILTYNQYAHAFRAGLIF